MRADGRLEPNAGRRACRRCNEARLHPRLAAESRSRPTGNEACGLRRHAVPPIPVVHFVRSCHPDVPV